jgi:glutamate racemase
MIGILDSGSGGLTVMRAIRHVLPSADVLYFGDIKHAPYGSRSQAELSLLTIEAIKLLRERGADRIVSACNSTSTSLALSVFDVFGLAPEHVIEMVGPTVSHLRGTDARIAVVATPATIRSGIYQNAFRMVGKEVVSHAIERLAGAIEFGASDDELREIVREALEVLPPVDVLVLACTHYPLVSHLFAELLPPTASLFDPAEAVAERVMTQFWPQEVRGGETTFLISAPSTQFEERVRTLFPNMRFSLEMVESQHGISD